MSWNSNHMNNTLSAGKIRGNVEVVSMKRMFALSDNELRKIDPNHTGQTKYADFQFLYFYIKNNCVVAKAAKDLNNASPGNFSRRLSLINVLKFGKVFSAYRMYRSDKGNGLKMVPTPRKKKKVYKTRKESAAAGIKLFNKRKEHHGLTAYEVVIKELAMLEKEVFNSRDIRTQIANSDIGRTSILQVLVRLWQTGHLHRLKVKGDQGAIYYRKTTKGFMSELETRGVIFSIGKDGCKLVWDGPIGVMKDSLMTLVRKHKSEIMNILRRRKL